MSHLTHRTVRRTARRTLGALVTGGLVAGLVVGPGVVTPATAAACATQVAPARDGTANQAPAPADDTARVIAGGSVRIQVLANDTDPDGDELYTVGVGAARRGEVCASPDGSIGYLAPPARRAYTDTFSYGVSDGDRYRTATVRISVEALKPVDADLRRKLTVKAGQVKRPARIAFTNTNSRRVLLVAGDPRRERPQVMRYLGAGRTTVVTTKIRRLVYLVAMEFPESTTFVNVGLLNTRTGKLRREFLGISFSADEGLRSDVAAALWQRRPR